MHKKEKREMRGDGMRTHMHTDTEAYRQIGRGDGIL